MSFAPHASEEEKLDRSINFFATQSFRDQADRDYIVARLACRYELFPQFLWAAHQAVEKYLKAILLFNRVKATRVGHDLAKALALTSGLSFTVELSPRSRAFIHHLARYGEFRYMDVPYHVYGHILVDLDLTVWELRRYCQVLKVFRKALPPQDRALIDEARSRLFRSAIEPRYKFRLQSGYLEQILSRRTHPSRSALLWHNACFGVRWRASVRVKNHLNAENSMLYLYPEMLDELLKYVFVPPKVVGGYRAHLTDRAAGRKR